MTLKETLAMKFVYIDEVANILTIGKDAKKNVFLYGRGGHAKSEIIQEFLKFVDPTGEHSFIQSCGEGLTEEKLFGGMNLAKFQKSGEIEYLVENSFMNKTYVVFEELLDSRMNVLLSLKDILTSGMFRQGKQQYPIKTQMVICLTNRTKQEVSEDNSIKALMERFPLELKVEWNSYNAADYCKMFDKVLGSQHQEVAEIINCINESGDFVSPRTAIHMAQVYSTTRDIGNLKYFGASAEIIEKLRKKKERAMEMQFISTSNYSYNNMVGKLEKVTTVAEVKELMREALRLLSAMNAREYDEANYSSYITVRDKLESFNSQAKDKLVNIVCNE